MLWFTCRLTRKRKTKKERMGRIPSGERGQGGHGCYSVLVTCKCSSPQQTKTCSLMSPQPPASLKTLVVDLRPGQLDAPVSHPSTPPPPARPREARTMQIDSGICSGPARVEVIARPSHTPPPQPTSQPANQPICRTNKQKNGITVLKRSQPGPGQAAHVLSGGRNNRM
jgi:hypothetical protein